MNFTVTYGKYHQFLNLVQTEGLSFADMWFPVDKTFPPGKADHFVLGFNYDNRKTFSVSVESYFKNYGNLAEYRTYRAANEPLENQTTAQNFLIGKGAAYGADIYIRNNVWGLEGWLGYSLSWSKKRINGFNFGETYYPTYDRRHTITAIQDYRLSKKWRLNFAFKFGSGQPYTEITARYAVMDAAGRISGETLAGKKNLFRLPAYHRLDIGVFYDTRLWGLPTEVFIQVINVYHHKNVWIRDFKVETEKTEVKDYHMLPFLPTAGLSVHF